MQYSSAALTDAAGTVGERSGARCLDGQLWTECVCTPDPCAGVLAPSVVVLCWEVGPLGGDQVVRVERSRMELASL